MVKEKPQQSWKHDTKSVVAKRRAAEKQARVDQILKAARKIFIKKGYTDATIRRIAYEATLSTGAIYAYFKGKDELFAWVYIETFKLMKDYMAKAYNTDLPIPEVFENWATAYWMFDQDYPEDSSILDANLELLDISQELRDKISEMTLKSLKESVDIFERGIKEGYFPGNMNKWEAAFLFYSAIEGIFYTLSYNQYPHLKFDGKALMRHQARIIIEGLRQEINKSEKK
ncbi:MAG: TetR/AcrR family transcriptional regulator [Desulfobacterales bacterium]|nr:TetR/AcrR family transcriptional regulator [Desulfobacterales bacterium]